MSTLPTSPRLTAKIVVQLAAFLGAFLFSSPVMAGPVHAFDIPAGDAVQTLRRFSEQSGEQILYPVEKVRGIRTQPIHGSLPAPAALEAMLANTGLTAVRDNASGAVVIRRADVDRHLPRRADANEAAGGTPAPAARANSNADLVVLSPFEVLSRSDLGYKAANSVSATRIAVPLGDLPMNVTAFTESFIADQKPYDLYDVVKWAPGIHEDNTSPQGWVRYNIRGFTSAAVQRNGFGSFRFIDTTDIERVEVVKGPASLLYGQMNPGGVINYITKRPLAEQQLQVTAAGGSGGYDRQVIDATGPVPGTDARLLYRIIGMREDIQEFQVLSTGTKYLFAPSLTWKLSDAAALTIDFEHFERRDRMPTGGVVLVYENGLPTIPYPNLPWNFSYAGKGDYQNFTSDALTADFTAKLTDRFNVRAVYLDSYWNMDWRATGQGGTGLLPQSVIDYYYPASAGLTPADAMFRRNRWEHQWGGERSGEVDLVGHFEFNGVKLRALLGDKQNFNTRQRAVQKNNPNLAGSPFYLRPWDLRNPATWDRSVPFGIDALVLAASTQAASEASSWYGVAMASAFDDRLKLLGGYARHELHNDPTYDYVGGMNAPASDRSASLPQAGGLLTITPGLSAYASYSESFLANNSLLRINNVPTIPAAPSIGRGYEAGFKVELLGGKVSGTISEYRITASPTGIITVTTGLDPNGTTLFTDVQGGSQVSEGTEIDLLFAPTQDLQVIAGFDRCDAVYRTNPINPEFNGTPLVATPDRTFLLWAKYAPHEGKFAGLTLAGGINHVGSMSYVGNNPLVRTSPYTTFDLTVGYRFHFLGRRWSADVTVKNVGDVHYYESASTWGFPRHGMLTIGTKF